MSNENECGDLEEIKYNELITLNTEVGKLIYYMMNNPDKFGSKKIWNKS